MEITHVKPGQAAAATVLVNGISIFSYNDDENCVDFGFLSRAVNETHPFRIRIFNVGGLFWSSDEQNRNFKNSITRIKTTSSKGVKRYQKQSGMQNDEQDYRWILNLSDDLYNGEEIKISAVTPDPLFAKLAIEDAVFYARVNSQKTAKMIDQKTGEEQDLRHLGRVVAADLDCIPEDTIEINVEWLESQYAPININLYPDQGPYTISVDYKCDRTNEEGSDFVFIYDAIVPPDGEVYDVMYPPGERSWGYRSIIGNRQSKKYIHECELEGIKKIEGLEEEFPHALRVHFNSAMEAQKSGYRAHNKFSVISGEYACQSSDTGGERGVPFPIPIEP